MTQLRRVRALHFPPCSLHTYSIGCAASQRNNIVTIHHTSAVNKTSGNFCHSLCSLSFAFLYFHPQNFCFFFIIYSVYVSLQSFSLLNRVPTTYSTHLFIWFFSFHLFARPLCPITIFFCTSHFLLHISSHPFSHIPFPLAYIFFLSASPTCSKSIRFPFCVVRQSLFF